MRRFILLLTCMLFVLPALAQQQLPPVDPATVSGDMIISGSPILESVTSNLVTRFTLEGYTGSITLSSNDTATSFQQLCRGDVDIVMADRSILPQELDACTAASRPPIGFRVATSAVIVAVSNQNHGHRQRRHIDLPPAPFAAVPQCRHKQGSHKKEIEHHACIEGQAHGIHKGQLKASRQLDKPLNQPELNKQQQGQN